VAIARFSSNTSSVGAANEIPTVGSRDVGRVSMIGLHFGTMHYTSTMDKTGNCSKLGF
jgi:hypothetical protein